VEWIVVNRLKKSMYRNVELRPQQEIFSSHAEAFEWIPPHMNTKTGPLTKGHNLYT
jgi:hypothetical protein